MTTIVLGCSTPNKDIGILILDKYLFQPKASEKFRQAFLLFYMPQRERYLFIKLANLQQQDDLLKRSSMIKRGT